MIDTSIVTHLHLLAHARAGDKGNRSNICVFAYKPEYWPLLTDQVTVDRVKALFAHRKVGNIIRYELPKLHALNFVIDQALEGGVNSSLAIDAHGKTLSFLVLGMQISVPIALWSRIAPGPTQATQQSELTITSMTAFSTQLRA